MFDDVVIIACGKTMQSNHKLLFHYGCEYFFSCHVQAAPIITVFNEVIYRAKRESLLPLGQ